MKKQTAFGYRIEQPLEWETDLQFGDYCTVMQKRHGVPDEEYLYKVIGTLESNLWAEVPVETWVGPIHHPDIEPVVNVICCGIAEDKVERYRISDVKKIHPSWNSHINNTNLKEIKKELGL